MAVPAKLLQQLLALDESERVEIAHTLLASVDADAAGMSAADREKLDASIERSLDPLDAGQTVAFTDVLTPLRAKRAARATR